jgi:hypothetical protein
MAESLGNANIQKFRILGSLDQEQKIPQLVFHVLMCSTSDHTHLLDLGEQAQC